MLLLEIKNSFRNGRKLIADAVTGFNLFGCLDFESEEKAIAFLQRLNHKGYVLYDDSTDTAIEYPYN